MKIISLLNLFLLIFMCPIVLFGSIHGFHYIISTHFYLFLRYFTYSYFRLLFFVRVLLLYFQMFHNNAKTRQRKRNFLLPKRKRKKLTRTSSITAPNLRPIWAEALEMIRNIIEPTVPSTILANATVAGFPF